MSEDDFTHRMREALGSLFNLARWLTGDDHAARDLVQETVEKGLRARAQVRGEDLRPWLFAILRNTHFASRRAPAGRDGDPVEFDETVHVDLHAAAAADPAELLAAGDRRAAVNAALRSLPAPFREVIILRDMEDLAYKDIAAIVGVPVGTVMSRLSRGRALLQQSLQHLNPGGHDGMRSDARPARRLH